MRRFKALLFVVVTATVTASAASPDTVVNRESSFSLGAKIGFAASSTYPYNIYMDGHNLREYTQDTQVGNFATLLVQWNLSRFMIQSGLGFAFNKSTFSIDRNSWDSESESQSTVSCSYSMISVRLPLQAGYNFVNQHPYSMTFYTGPSIRLTPDRFYSVTYNNCEPYKITDNASKMVLGWSAGLIVKIGRTFMDMEYEATMNSMSGPLRDESGLTPPPDYSMERRMGIISFSYGMMF